MSFWRCKLTPGECRLLAREGFRFLTTAELAFRARISKGRVWWIARQSWDKIPIGEAVRYLNACGIGPHNLRRHVAYLKRALRGGHRTFPHLRRLSKREKQTLLKLI